MKNLFLSLLFLSTSLFAKESCDSYSKRIDLLTKIGYAPTNSSMAELSKYCSYKYWIKDQLENPKKYDDSKIINKFSNYEIQKKNNLEMMLKYHSTTPLNESNIMKESSSIRINYAIYSENRIREMMVWFWFNHFNVYGDSGAFRYMKSYEDIFRNKGLSDFKSILSDVVFHPAMLLYLDNDLNNKEMLLENEKIGSNDNFARELLELHTLGVDAGYSENDVKNLAKILTGLKSIQQYDFLLDRDFSFYKKEYYKINNLFNLRKFYENNKNFKVSHIYDNYSLYYNDAHDNSTKQFLGQTIHGSYDKEIQQIIDILSKHPSTAKHISKKLSIFFLGYESKNLIEKMSNMFLSSNGNIAKTLEILLLSEEFENNLKLRNQFKNPYEYYISTAKLIINNSDFQNTHIIDGILNNLSFGIYMKSTPEGYSLFSENYKSANLLHQYLNFSQFVTSKNFLNYNLNWPATIFQKDRTSLDSFLSSKEWINK